MAIKVQIMKTTGEGETTAVEVHVPEVLKTAAEIHAYLNKVYGAIDTRIWESSKRIMEAMKFEQQVPAETRAGARYIATQVLSMVHGKAGDPGAVHPEAVQADQAAVAVETEKLGGPDALKSNVIEGRFPTLDALVEDENARHRTDDLA